MDNAATPYPNLSQQEGAMRLASEPSTVGQYFSEKWQRALARFFGVTLDTTVRSIWVVDNPARSYQFQERRIVPDQLRPGQQQVAQYAVYPITLNWNWFSPEDSPLSRIRLDYHADEDILYILNQEHRRHSLTVYDVMKP